MKSPTRVNKIVILAIEMKFFYFYDFCFLVRYTTRLENTSVKITDACPPAIKYTNTGITVHSNKLIELEISESNV